MLSTSNLTTTMRRFVPLLVAACALMAVAASPSQAGTYTVTACNAAAGSVNNAWIASSTSAKVTTSQTCPSSGVSSGLLAQDVLASGLISAGLGAVWSLTAPAGTEISAVTYDRYVHLDGDDGWIPGLRLADGTSFDRCTIAIGDSGCSVGSGPAGTGGSVTRTGVSTSSLTFGLICGATGGASCGAGGTLHSATAAMYGSTVTISDTVDPGLSGAGGALTSPSGYRTGSQSGTLNATDATGIKQTSVYVDGVQYDPTARTCDFTFVVPCSNLSGATLSLNTAQVADGTHAVQLAAVDAAGNESKTAAVSMTFDNTAPAAPTGLTVAGGATKTTNSFDVSWTNPASPQVAPLANVRYQVGSGPAQTIGVVSQINGLTVPAAGTYTLRVWLVDAAGNADPSAAATTTLTYQPATGGGGGGGGGGGAGGSSKPPVPAPVPDPVVPQPPPAPATPPVPPAVTPPAPGAVRAELVLSTFKRKGATLRVAGRLARSATGRVAITYSARVGGRVRRQSTKVKIRRGRYSAALRLRGALARTKRGTVTVAYAGNAAVKAGRTHATVR